MPRHWGANSRSAFLRPGGAVGAFAGSPRLVDRHLRLPRIRLGGVEAVDPQFVARALPPLLTTASLFAGLLTASLAALIAIRSTDIVASLRPGGYWTKLVRNVRAALRWLVVFIATGAACLVVTYGFDVDLNHHPGAVGLLVGLFTTAVLATVRVVRLVLTVAEKVA